MAKSSSSQTKSSLSEEPYGDVLTTGEVAEICFVSKTVVLDWIDEGLLKGAYKLPLGNARRVPIARMIDFIRSHKIPIRSSSLPRIQLSLGKIDLPVTAYPLKTGDIAKICSLSVPYTQRLIDQGTLHGSYIIPGTDVRRLPIESLQTFLGQQQMPTDKLTAFMKRNNISTPTEIKETPKPTIAV
jgi:hypothetical protein